MMFAVAQVVVLAQVLAADINIGYEEGLVNTQARHSAFSVRGLAHRTQLQEFWQALIQQALTVSYLHVNSLLRSRVCRF